MTALPTNLSTDPKSLSCRGISCVRVALDVPLARLFDYAQAGGAPAQIGDRVVVPFGARQQLGVVIEAQADSDVPVSRMKAITAIRDDAPRLPKDWLELMRFLAGYYQRPLGETLISSLPPRLRSLKPLPRKALASGAQPSSARFVATYTLTDKQRAAFEAINEAFGRFRALLLHGVTGS